MPNGGTKTHAGDGSAIAPDDKALDKKGLIWKAWTRRCRKTEQDAYRESPPTEAPVNKASDKKNGQQTERP